MTVFEKIVPGSLSPRRVAWTYGFWFRLSRNFTMVQGACSWSWWRMFIAAMVNEFVLRVLSVWWFWCVSVAEATECSLPRNIPMSGFGRAHFCPLALQTTLHSAFRRGSSRIVCYFALSRLWYDAFPRRCLPMGLGYMIDSHSLRLRIHVLFFFEICVFDRVNLSCLFSDFRAANLYIQEKPAKYSAKNYLLFYNY